MTEFDCGYNDYFNMSQPRKPYNDEYMGGWMAAAYDEDEPQDEDDEELPWNYL